LNTTFNSSVVKEERMNERKKQEEEKGEGKNKLFAIIK
jgi:hypothetical protein